MQASPTVAKARSSGGTAYEKTGNDLMMTIPEMDAGIVME
jgi:hypothetical protein